MIVSVHHHDQDDAQVKDLADWSPVWTSRRQPTSQKLWSLNIRSNSQAYWKIVENSKLLERCLGRNWTGHCPMIVQWTTIEEWGSPPKQKIPGNNILTCTPIMIALFWTRFSNGKHILSKNIANCPILTFEIAGWWSEQANWQNVHLINTLVGWTLFPAWCSCKTITFLMMLVQKFTASLQMSGSKIRHHFQSSLLIIQKHALMPC